MFNPTHNNKPERANQMSIRLREKGSKNVNGIFGLIKFWNVSVFKTKRLYIVMWHEFIDNWDLEETEFILKVTNDTMIH